MPLDSIQYRLYYRLYMRFLHACTLPESDDGSSIMALQDPFPPSKVEVFHVTSDSESKI